MAQGGRFALATGRALAAIEKLVDDIPTNSPAVICNGAALYDFQAGKYLDIIMLDEVVSQRCQEVLERFPTTAVEAYPLENVIHAVRPNLYTRQHEHVTHVAVHEDASIMDIPRPMTKLMFEDCHETLLDIRAFLLSQPWIGGYEVFFSDRTLLEMTARGACKGGHGDPPGPAAGHRGIPCVLRGRRGQRSEHAGHCGGGLCPGQLCGGRAAKPAPLWWPTATTTPWRTWWPAWRRSTAEMAWPRLGYASI